MAEMQGRTMAMPADERMMCCERASGQNRQHSSEGGLAWYFAQPSMSGPVYVATTNGYMGSDPDETKGGKENV